MPDRLRPIIGLAIAAAGGTLFWLIHFPLAWMIGAMVATALSTVFGPRRWGWGFKPPVRGRFVGQTIIGAAIGLFFTPAAVQAIMNHAGAIVVATVATLIIGIICAVFMARLAHVDAAQAFFASVPGGPSDMANLAERYGGSGAATALAQSLRVVLLVTIVPPALMWSGIGGTPDKIMTTGTVYWPGLVLLMALATVGAWLAFKTRIPNACLLGSMSVTGTLTAFGFELSAIPFPVVAAGQVLLGGMLGTMFDRAFLRRAGSFAVVAVGINLLLIVLCTGFAWLVTRWTQIPLPTSILALAPGGIAEMGVTAKVLHLDVAMIAAFHVFRIFTVVSAAPFVFDGLIWLTRIARRSHPEGGD